MGVIVAAMGITALIAPMNLLLRSLAHALNSTKILVAIAGQWHILGIGALGVPEHHAKLGKVRRS